MEVLKMKMRRRSLISKKPLCWGINDADDKFLGFIVAKSKNEALTKATNINKKYSVCGDFGVGCALKITE